MKKYKKSIKKIGDDLAALYEISSSHFVDNTTASYSKTEQNKASDLDKLTLLMKEQISASDYKNKLKILTLTPESWTRDYASNYFEVSVNAIRTARHMKRESGILSLPLNKIGKSVPLNVVSVVQSFYEDDEYSRTMSGKKDYVSVGKGKNNRIHVQKRLLLCNLKELYSQFKVINPEIKLGISKFCSLMVCKCWSIRYSLSVCMQLSSKCSSSFICSEMGYNL